MIKQLAKQMEAIVTKLETMTEEEISSLPTNRFRKDLISDLEAAGLSKRESQIIAMRAKLTLSHYDANSEDFKSLRKSFVKMSVLGKTKMLPFLSSEAKDEWVNLIELSLEL